MTTGRKSKPFYFSSALVTSVLIRESVESDMVHTSRICNDCWLTYYPSFLGQETVDEMLEKRRNAPLHKATKTTLVAEENNVVLGFCFFDACDIVALYVAPESTGKGVGAALIREAIKRMKPTCPVITTSTLTKNESALRFYKREGFKEVGPGTHTHHGITMDTIKLELV